MRRRPIGDVLPLRALAVMLITGGISIYIFVLCLAHILASAFELAAAVTWQ